MMTNSGFSVMGKTIVISFVVLCMLQNCACSLSGGTNKTHNQSSSHRKGIAVAGWHYEAVGRYITLAVFVSIVCILKTLYHRMTYIASYIPESNILIVLGVLFGVTIYFAVNEETRTKYWSLDPHIFFFVLLPPIMLEAAYSLYDKHFVDNILIILYFAVIGTVLNCLIIGFALYGLSECNAMGHPHTNLTMESSLLFSSLIVAVDPVAVLAIFHEIGVQASLYYTVFGESLLNDAVTVVLYNMFTAFATMPTTRPVDVVLGIVSFFTISLGGLAIGIIIGALCCFITKFTYTARVVEPMIVFSMALLAYYVADLVGWSGIISIIGCGLVQASYAFHNISRKSLITVKYFSKVMASISEAIVFLFLGLELVSKRHIWHTGFALWSMVLCLVARFAITFISSFVMNLISDRPVGNWRYQFIIAFGGLRGAVAFALAATLDEHVLRDSGVEKNMFLTTTLFVIMFTCFVMGMLVKPIVKLLKISLEDKSHSLSVFQETNDHFIAHLCAGIEEIVGKKGKNYLREWVDHVDDNFIRGILQREPHTHDEKIVDIYHEVSLKIHYATTHCNKDTASKVAQQLAPALEHKLTCPHTLEDLQMLAFPSFPATRFVEDTIGIHKSDTEMDVRKELRRTRRNSNVHHGRINKNLKSEHDLWSKFHEARTRAIQSTSYKKPTDLRQRIADNVREQNAAYSPDRSAVVFSIDEEEHETVPKTVYRPVNTAYNSRRQAQTYL